MMYIVFEIIASIIGLILAMGCFFVLDDLVLHGYVATKLRKRFNVKSL